MINILNKCKVNHTGFTLAEVLITLGIIGVVAAMTIPTLTSKIQNLQYATAYRKAFSSLNQALRLMQNDGYDIDLSNPGAVYQADGIIGENFKILSTSFTGATTCFEHNAKKCFECDKGQSGQGSFSNKGRGCNNQTPAFMDASGMQYYLYAGSEWPIIIDVNGFSKPNELGKDRYVVYFGNSKSKDSKYSAEVDAIIPWKDIKTKQRWCPSGDCPNTSRLFEGHNNSLNIDVDGDNSDWK